MQGIIKEVFMQQDIEQSLIKVLIKIDDDNNIIKITSSVFSKDDELIIIDEGNGDKYAHAQSQYLGDGVLDEYGRYNFSYINGQIEKIVYDDAPQVQVDLNQVVMELALENAYQIALIKLGVME